MLFILFGIFILTCALHLYRVNIRIYTNEVNLKKHVLKNICSLEWNTFNKTCFIL